MKRTGIRIAVATLAGGMIGAAQLPAFAAPNAPATVSIAAKSLLPKVTGYVFVTYLNGKYSNAQITGSVSGGASGEVLRLYAQQFPFKKAPARLGAPITLTATGTSPYSFTVTPTLATRYKAELFATGTSTTPLASSATTTVYVVATTRYGGLTTCGRPTCHETVRVRTIVPPSTLRTEIAKRWFPYFGINLSTTGQPPPPKFLHLGAGNARVSRAQRVNSHQYLVTLSVSFRIGNDGYYYLLNTCQRDTEATDGLNLPGHHGCGLTVISSSQLYLG